MHFLPKNQSSHANYGVGAHEHLSQVEEYSRLHSITLAQESSEAVLTCEHVDGLERFACPCPS